MTHLKQAGSRWWTLPLGILAVGLLVAIALFVAGTIHSGDLGLELAKGGIQLLVVVILGSAVAFGFRSLDDRRTEERRVDEYRANFVAELWSAYHRVKAVRRTLTAYGFASTTGQFTDEQCREYDQQMKELDDAQLTLETLKRTVENDDGRIFASKRTEIRAKVSTAERYVNHVIDDWEAHRDDVRPGADRASVIANQANLKSFLGPANADDGLKTKLSGSIGAAVRLVQEIRFPLNRG